ncbi:hypothetical protein ACVMDN_006884 [Bradyrhizobium sp. USDA 4510]
MAATRSGTVHESPVRDQRTRPTPTKNDLPDGPQSLVNKRSPVLKEATRSPEYVSANPRARFQR